MKIVAIREKTFPIASPIRNAVIDFSKMTLSAVAVVTDVLRGGRPVVGYGFNSNGRYGQGALLRERFIPRVMEAEPRMLLDETGDNFDPRRIWDCAMRNEKPGGHGERSVAVGTLDMAVWDAVAKIAGKPLYRMLAERHGDGRVDETVFVYAAGGYYYPGKDHAQLQDEMKKYLDRGYTVVKMKIGGASLDEDLRRIDAVLEVVGKAGVVQTLDSKEVPFYDRLYLGGQNDLRGFDYRGVGPRAVTQDGLSYEPIGGDTRWFGSVEYSIPIVDHVRFALFFDIGNVSASPWSNKSSDVLGKTPNPNLPPPFVQFGDPFVKGNTGGYSDNYGLGIHINIPHLGPLRLDYGIPIHHDAFSGSNGKLQFGVGFSRPL